MPHRFSSWGLSLSVAWLILGTIASLVWFGVEWWIVYWTSVLPAFVLYSVGLPEGSLWMSGHSPPILTGGASWS
jgi:hypothetical protein